MSYTLRPEILDTIRHNRGLTSDEHLARELNLSLGTISGIRRGRQPSLATALRVMDAAGVTDLRAAFIETTAA